jgi:hypothetical protein
LDKLYATRNAYRKRAAGDKTPCTRWPRRTAALRDFDPFRPAPCRLGVDTVEKDFKGGSPSNIDSRRASNEQHRFKNPFARIRLFQLLIPQLHFGYFFNSIGQPRPKHLGRWANHVRNALRAYTISDAAPGDGRNTNELRCSPSRQPRAHRVNRVNLLLDRLRLAAPRAAAPRIAFHCREGPANPAGTKQ